MRVKIGDTIYDSEIEPIMVILSDLDKLNICNMKDDDFKYCSFPARTDLNKIKKFMKT